MRCILPAVCPLLLLPTLFAAAQTPTPAPPRQPNSQTQAAAPEATPGSQDGAGAVPRAGSAATARADAEHRTDAATLGQQTPPQGKPVPEAPADASIDALKRIAAQQVIAGQIAAARATLDRIRAKSPNEPGIHGFYAYLDEQDGRLDEALTEYRREAALHPDVPNLAESIARVQQRQGKSAEARETLQNAFSMHPDNVRLGYQLAANKTAAGDAAGAAKTLELLSSANPGNAQIRIALGNALFAAGRKDDAAAVGKTVLEGSTDPGILNDAGYLLAETGRDLPEAEAVLRKSIATLEEKSRSIPAEEINTIGVQQSNLLIAGWDTLGWILFQEGKLDEAESYIAASWRNDQHPEVGEHLGRVLEARGNKAAAREQFALARASEEPGNSTPAVRKQIADDLGRYGHAPVAKQANRTPTVKEQAIAGGSSRKEAFARSPAEAAELQQLHTYRVDRPEGAKGRGTVRLQLSVSKVEAVAQTSGDTILRPVLAALKPMHIPGLLPVGSAAFLLRSGVLTCGDEPQCELVLVPSVPQPTAQHP